VPTFGTLIKAAALLKRIGQCWEFWRRIEQRGMEPNDIVLGCMLDALVSNQEVDQAVDLLNKWKTRVPPNTIMVSTILKGFAVAQQCRRAMAMWKDMRAEGLKMNTIAYNAVIDVFARGGQMDAVSELVAAMESDCVVPDAITLSTIVKGYCVKGDFERAIEVFRNMQKSGMVKDSIVYNTLLDGCVRHASYALADRLLAEMDHANIYPSNFTLGILVKMYGRRRQLDKAFDAIEKAQRVYGFAPSPQVRTCLMCSCLNNNAFDRAMAVFKEIQQNSPQGADGRAVSAIVLGCVRHGELSNGCEILERAYSEARKPCPDFGTEPLAKLVQALRHTGQMDTLGSPLLNRLRSRGVGEASRLLLAGDRLAGSKNRADWETSRRPA